MIINKFTNLESVLQEYANEVVTLYKKKLLTHVATGDLINSVRCEVRINGNNYGIELSLADHWKYLEYDTKPHFPPVDKLLKWVEVKRIIPHEVNGIIPKKESLAYLIGRKIDREGTKGTHDLENTLSELNLKYEDKISGALELDILDSLDDVLI